MSVLEYDKALKSKIQNVFDNVVLAEPDMAFKRSAELPENEGKVKLPLLSLYRENYTILLESVNQRAFRRGKKVAYPNEDSDDYSTVQMMESLPVRIDYQLDLWADRRDTVDNLAAEVLFWLLGNPKIEIPVPETDRTMEFSFWFEDMQDNSDIMSFEEKGRLYRITIPLYFDEARILRTDEIKTALDVEYELISTDEL